MKRGRALALGVVGLLAICGATNADGKLSSVADDARVPNQKALLWLENGRQTLILAGLAREEWTFLTELCAGLAAEEMIDNVALARAPMEAPYGEVATAEQPARRAGGARGGGRGLGPTERQSGRVPPGNREEVGDAVLTEPEFLLLGILAGLVAIMIGRGLLRRAARRRGQ